MRRLIAVAVLLAAGCGDSNTPSGAGDLFVSYSGTGEAGAILLTISGGPVESVAATGGQQVSSTSPYANTTKVIVLGEVGNGDLLRIRVPDVSKVTQYAVRADQVADKTSFALLDPTRHTFSVHK
jgi:hypothetical protein